ncbi:hypothetical protein Droror1_Dr00027456 [Drosera rotundifolia]
MWIRGTLTQYLVLLGLQHASAAFCSAFVNMSPANTFLITLIFRVERLNLRSKGGKAKVLGSAMCIGGVLVLALYQGFPLTKHLHSHEYINRARDAGSNASPKSTSNYIVSAICMTSSSIVWSSWFVVQNWIGKLYPCKYSSTAFMSFFSAIQSAALCWAINSDPSVWLLRGKLQIVTVILAGVVGSGLCYVGMSWCVEQRGPVFTAAFSPFQQIFLVILALIFLREDVYLGSVLGSIAVICGLYILLWGKSKDIKDEALKPADLPKETGRTSLSTSCTIHVDADTKCHLGCCKSAIRS